MVGNNKIRTIGSIIKACETGDFTQFEDSINGFYINGDETLLNYCCRKGLTESVKKMLLCCPDVDVNKRSEKGQSPLLASIVYNNYNITKLLIVHPNLNTVAKEAIGMTCLDFALMKGELLAVKLLLLRDMNLASDKHINEPCIAKLLVKYKSNPELTKFEISQQLGIHIPNIKAEVCCLIVLLCDDYLRIKCHNNINNTSDDNNDDDIKRQQRKHKQEQQQNQAIRFFNITSRLPLELQMTICNRVVGSRKTFVKSFEFETSLETVITGINQMIVSEKTN